MRVASIGIATAAFLSLAAESSALAPPSAYFEVSATDQHRFEPDHLTLQVHRLQTITFTSVGSVRGIASAALGIPPTRISPGTPSDVVVTPKHTGTYLLPCTVGCGSTHGAMHLTIDVVK